MSDEGISKTIRYQASPTMAKFHSSNAPVKGIMGPIGSGKSVGCILEVLTRSQRQAPDYGNIRRTRWAVIRQTYPELKSTTIKSWQDWIPNEIFPITYGAPITARMIQKLPDGTTMDMEVFFVSVDRPKDMKKVLGLELTGAWINEAREIGKHVVDGVFSRTGRYPGKKYGAPLTWTGLIMDTNPMDDDHWWYRMAEQQKPDGWDFFRQPGALNKILDGNGSLIGYEANPRAENVKHQPLGFRYWLQQVQGADPQWVDAMVCGNYASVHDGRAVYKDIYNDRVHHSPVPLEVFRGMDLLMGWDFGLTPSCILGQLDPEGQLRILREYVCDYGGLKQFAGDVVIPRLNSEFSGIPVRAWGDPAGNQKSQSDDTQTCFNMLAQLGIPAVPTVTNAFIPRRQSVIDRLSRTVGSARPAFITDPSISILRKGFLGGYKFERVQVTGEERYKDQPAKNRFSHPHDALQYLCVGIDTLHIIDDNVTVPDAPAGDYAWGGF
jgi:hypothetical protein